MANFLEKIDDKLLEIVSEWNVVSTVLLAFIATAVILSFFTSPDPDVHPRFLQRQASASQVRKPGESAIYRHYDCHDSSMLCTGLNAKLPTDPPYSAAHTGDLRYVWNKVIGEWPQSTIESAPGPQYIQTVHGLQDIKTHDLEQISKEIKLIGHLLSSRESKRIGIYLPNSVEFLSTLLACSFYGLDAILIPHHLSQHEVVKILHATAADALVASAGTLPLTCLTSGKISLKQVIWCVEETSRHMDWTEVPEGSGGAMDVAVWHDVVNYVKDDTVLPPPLETNQLGKIITVMNQKQLDKGQLVESTKYTNFTQANFTAATASIITALPRAERLNSKDTVLCADTFTNSYALCQVLAALYSGASLVITSSASSEAELCSLTMKISPTVVVASASSAVALHKVALKSVNSGLGRFSHALKLRSLDSGKMPLVSSNSPCLIGSTPGALRLLFVSEKSKCLDPPLSPSDLCDLRALTGARVLYALTAAEVAGAVTQTYVYDYRRNDPWKRKSQTGHSHFGVPMSCLEIKLVDYDDVPESEVAAKGTMVVSGSSISGGQANLNIAAVFQNDYTLAYS